jgi:hypothetical protein
MATRGNLTDEKFRELREREVESRRMGRYEERVANVTANAALCMPSRLLTDTSSNEAGIVLYRPLVEPIFQDLSYNERFFVDYCKLFHRHASQFDRGR